MLIYLVTAVAVVAYLALRTRKSHSEITRAIQKELKELLLFVSIIGSLFTLIQIAIALMPVAPSDTLLSLERKIVWLRKITDTLTMPAWVQVLSFMGLLFFAFMSTRMARLKALGRLSTTNTYIAKAHLFLTLASALTFFGAGAASGAAHKQAMLVAQIEETTRGYEDAAKGIENEAVQAAVAQLTDSQTHPQLAAFIATVDKSRLTAKQIESSDSRLPSEKEYARARADYSGAPESYHTSADFSDIQANLRSATKDDNGTYHPPSSASVTRNAEVKDTVSKIQLSVRADEFKTAIAESVDAVYDSSTDKIISVIAVHASPKNLSAQLTEVLLKKAFNDGLKEFLKDKIAEALTAIYEKRMSPAETLSAMTDKVRSWVSARSQEDLPQIDPALASSAADTAESIRREAADVNQVARDFAIARSQQLDLSSHELVSNVVLSHSDDIETIWAEVKTAPASNESNYFERLGQSEKKHVLATKLHDAGDSITAEKGPLKAAAAIEYEALCCGTQRLSDAYSSEADTILALEPQSHWGEIRAIAERAVARNVMNYDPSNIEAAEAAVSNWNKYKSRLAVAAAKDGFSARRLQADQWDEWFAEYLTKHGDMAALWGFVVISTTDDDRLWEPYYQERIREANFKTLNSYARKQQTDIFNPTDGLDPKGSYNFNALRDLLKGNTNSAGGIKLRLPVSDAEQKIRAHGPYPRDGYRYFMSQMHVQSDADAKTYFSSSEMAVSIDKFCPRTQLSR